MFLKSDSAVGGLSVLRFFPLPIISYFIQGFLNKTDRKPTQTTARKKNNTLTYVMQFNLKRTIKMYVYNTVNL